MSQGGRLPADLPRFSEPPPDVNPVPISETRRCRDALLALLDGASLLSSLVLIRWLVVGHVDDASWIAGLTAAVAFYISGQVTGIHRRRDAGSADVEISQVVTTWGITLFALAMIAFVSRFGDALTRSEVFAWVLLAPALVGLFRMVVRLTQWGLLRQGVGARRVAIAGRNRLGRQTATNIAGDSSLGFRLVGIYDDRDAGRSELAAGRADEESELPDSEITTGDLTRTGDLASLVTAAKAGQIDTVLVTLPMRAEGRIRYLLDQLSDSTVSVYIVPDFFVFELLHSRWTSVGGLPAVSVFESPLFGVDGVAKRFADVTLATLGIVVASIPMLLIAVAIKVTSPGPVFFRQRRYGLDGREIRVWKFRSMRTYDDGEVVRQATKGDARVTPVGAVLRKTSLDELPQLFNVIQGTMSLVGPRPHASAHNEQYRRLIRGYMLRHKVKPGITGLAQVNGCRGETETVDKMKRRVDWDHRYLRGWSLWLDLKILFKTVLIVWKQPEAY